MIELVIVPTEISSSRLMGCANNAFVYSRRNAADACRLITRKQIYSTKMSGYSPTVVENYLAYHRNVGQYEFPNEKIDNVKTAIKYVNFAISRVPRGEKRRACFC